MNAPHSDLLKRFIAAQPKRYRYLCFWARKRGIENPSEQVNQYLSELVLKSNSQVDNAALLQRWVNVLSPQERISIADLTFIPIGIGPVGKSWYILQKGEYSIFDEPVLEEINYAGQQQASITRNRYDCLILNTKNLLFVDVDIGVPAGADPRDCAVSCRKVISQQQAIAALESIVLQDAELGFRVYRTRNGLRYLCPTRPFDPLSDETDQMMRSLYADPLYAKLCRFQATFRARLTPKPWRVEIEEETEQFRYDPMTGLVLPDYGTYGVCHLIKVIGQPKILPQFESVIQIHDAYCQSDRLQLSLA
ncbi:hypothetical protein [Leptolyngbya ohadii]|uniref:hypothetical protein n=1 Tax=Leptolyngbya ohadii TaxID=1962290 RepID=UPI000B59961C|nr:hypothetical protein [Leptolyngbya ohadii]